MSATNLPIGPEGKVNKAYQVSSWPTHVLIDAEGNLRCLGRFSAVTEALEGMRREGELAPAQ